MLDFGAPPHLVIGDPGGGFGQVQNRDWLATSHIENEVLVRRREQSQLERAANVIDMHVIDQLRAIAKNAERLPSSNDVDEFSRNTARERKHSAAVTIDIRQTQNLEATRIDQFPLSSSFECAVEFVRPRLQIFGHRHRPGLISSINGDRRSENEFGDVVSLCFTPEQMRSVNMRKQ